MDTVTAVMYYIVTQSSQHLPIALVLSKKTYEAQL